MISKTEYEQSSTFSLRDEFTPGFIRWMAFLTILTVIFVMLPLKVLQWGPPTVQSLTQGERGQDFFTALPWLVAGRFTVQQGIREFTGHRPVHLSQSLFWSTLIAMLLGFVVGPTLLFIGWRGNHNEQKVAQSGNRLTQQNVLFGFGAGLTFFVLLPAMISFKEVPLNYESMKSGQARSELRDQMLKECSEITYSAYQYRILPLSLNGGGGRSYLGYKIPDSLVSIGERTYAIVRIDSANILLKGISANPATVITVPIDSMGNSAPNFEN